MRITETIIDQTAEQRQEQLAAWQLWGDPADMVFVDIETTGFSRLYDSVYLVGLLYDQNGRLAAKQFLASSLGDEMQVLREALDQLRQFQIWVTYNGDMFDLPFIEERAKRLRVWSKEDEAFLAERKSVDLLRAYRRYQSFFGWPNMKLKTLEAFLQAERQDPFDGGQLIEVFYEYARTDDARLEAVLLLHNYEDICYLPLLFRVQQFMEEIRCGTIEQVRYEDGELLMIWDKAFSLSHKAETALNRKKRKDPAYPRAQFYFEAKSRCSRIQLPACEEPVFYFLPNAKDYYYIPEREEIVHKSLAFDVPPKQRRKARPAECVLRGQGRFVQVLPAGAGIEDGVRRYQKEYRGAEVYAEESELRQWLEAAPAEEAAAWARQFFELL